MTQTGYIWYENKIIPDFSKSIAKWKKINKNEFVTC